MHHIHPSSWADTVLKVQTPFLGPSQPPLASQRPVPCCPPAQASPVGLHFAYVCPLSMVLPKSVGWSSNAWSRVALSVYS